MSGRTVGSKDDSENVRPRPGELSVLDRMPDTVAEAMQSVGFSQITTHAEDLVCPLCGELTFEMVDITGHTFEGWPCCDGLAQTFSAWGVWDELEEHTDRGLRRDLVNTAAGHAHQGRGRIAKRVQGREVYLVSFGLRAEAVPKMRVMEAIDKHHRHHGRPQLAIEGIEVWNGPTRVGVGVLSTPVSRVLMERGTHLELSRACTWGSPFLRKNAISKMTAEARTVARRLRDEAARELERGPAPRPEGQIGLFDAQRRGGHLSRRERRKMERRAGIRALRTYILDKEKGTSWKAAGWKVHHMTKGGTWDRVGRRRKRRTETEGPKKALDTPI